jgi:hypothetical protein
METHKHTTRTTRTRLGTTRRKSTLRPVLAWASSTKAAAIMRTFFRRASALSRTEDGWEYLKDGRWKEIPPDIIKEEDTPDHLPVLFINKHDGRELCFFLPKGGL